MKKKIIALILFAVMAFAFGVGASALNYTDALRAAKTLNHLGLFNGTGTDIYGNPNFDLNIKLTREQAVTLLVRLLGKEDEALSGTWDMPFEDVSDWAKPYVGYAYANGLTSGIGPSSFGGDMPISASQYITFLLRALGYSSETDFSWDKSWKYAANIGVCAYGAYNEENDDDFRRGDAVIVSLKAIGKPHKQTGERIAERIYEEVLGSEESAFSLDKAMEDIWNVRNTMFISDVDCTGANKMAPQNSSAKALLTSAEIKALKTTRGFSDVTYEEALEDVDLYFRSYKYAYGAYYYFGDELFDEIKADVIADLEGRESIKATELNTIIRRHMARIQDGHLGRGDVDEYEYRYTDDISFLKDSKGYYAVIDGEKWYYEGSSDKNVTIERSLTKYGALVYRPVWFYHESAKVNESEIYLSLKNQTRTETVTWREGAPYSATASVLDYQFLRKNGIAYISIRSFNNSFGAASYNGFLSSATQIKNSEIVILDLRSNGGGTDYYPREWIKKFAGVDYVQYRAKYVSRNTALTGNAALGQETITVSSAKGKVIPNDKLFIILTDDKCGSAGEFGVQLMNTLENSIVIGGPTAGRTFCCGSLPKFYLPNSGVSYTFGTTAFCFDDEMNNDDIGITPDIWCDPQTALDAVLMMLVREGKTDVANAWSLREVIK